MIYCNSNNAILIIILIITIILYHNSEICWMPPGDEPPAGVRGRQPADGVPGARSTWLAGWLAGWLAS